MSQDKRLPPSEWLEKRIEDTIEQKGRMSGFYENAKSTPMWVSGESAYGWLDYLIGELLQTYRVLKTHEEHLDTDAKRWRRLIGLADDSSPEMVDARLTEMRNIFTEMRRVRGEREGKIGNET
jgi:hypothetical protein